MYNKTSEEKVKLEVEKEMVENKLTEATEANTRMSEENKNLRENLETLVATGIYENICRGSATICVIARVPSR